jgi:YbbR domain-containing protein
MNKERWRWIFDNGSMKAGAFVTAMVVWLVIYGGSQEERVFRSVPVVIRLPAGQDFGVIGQTDREAQVVLRGPQSYLRSFAESLAGQRLQVVVVDDGKNLATEKHVTLRQEHLDPPASGTVLIEPSDLRYTVDRWVTQSVPVRVDFAPPKGYQVAIQNIVPSQVKVRGPSRLMERVRNEGLYIKTRPLEPSQLRDTRIHPGLPLSDTIEGVAVECSESVNVAAQVTRELLPKTLQGIVLYNLLPDPFPFVIADRPPVLDQLVVQGPETLPDKRPLADLKASDIRAYLDFSDPSIQRKGVHELPVRVELPPGVELVPPPPTVSVRLEKP